MVTISKTARAEIASLSDEALMAVHDLIKDNYRDGYEYAEFRRMQSALCGVPEEPAEEVLKVVCRPTPLEEFRVLIRGV